MILKSIRIKNIRSYLDEKIDFPPGSVLLSGDIGSGKSTILLAIEFALFGIQRGEVGGADLLRHGKNEGLIELDFELTGKTVKLCRTLKRTNTSVVQDSGYIEIEGYREELAPSEIKTRVYKMFGYPSDMLNKKSLLFRYTVYTPQEKMKEIVFLDSLGRLDIIRKLFGIDKYGRIRENARTVAAELRSIHRSMVAAAEGLPEKRKEMEGRKSEIIDIIEKIEKQTAIVKSIEQEYEKRKLESDQWKERMNEMQEKKQLFNRIDASIHKNIRSIENLKNNRQSLLNSMSSIKKELVSLRDIKEEDCESMEGDIQKMRAEINEFNKKLTISSEEISRLSKILDDGICKTCGQKVNDPESFRTSIENEKTFSAGMKEKMSRMEEKLKKLMEQLSAARRNAILIERRKISEKRLSDFENSMQRQEEEKALLEKETVELEIKHAELANELKSFEEAENQIKEAEKSLSEIITEQLEHAKALSRYEQMRESTEKMMKMLEKDIEKMEEAKIKAERVSSVNVWLTSFFVPLTEKIEQHTLLVVQQEFNRFFQDWFSILVEDENLTVMVNENFDPVINQNGYITEFNNLSGGEKTSVALAYRLALNKVINNLIEGIKTNDLIILDEPTDGFSTEQLDKVRDVLDQLGLKQVIIVSHEQKMDSFVNNVIRIEKQEHVSRIS